MTKSKQQITYQTDSNGKKILTTDVIKNTLIANTCKQKQTYSGLLMVGGCLLLCFAIVCTVLGGFMGLIFFIPGVLCLYFGKKKNKIAQENKINTTNGNYRIIKTECIEFTKEYIEDSEGGGWFTYKHRFANAPDQELKLEYGFAQKGEVVYLVYLADCDKIGAFFNPREFTISSDLIIEEVL